MTMDMSGVDVYVDYHIGRYAEVEVLDLRVGNQDVYQLFQEYGMYYDVYYECLGQGNDNHE